MKQLIIIDDKLVSVESLEAACTTPKAFGFFDKEGSLLSAAKADRNFCVVYNRPDKAPIVFPEVDAKTLTATAAAYSAGTVFKANINTLDVGTEGAVFSINIIKEGAKLNERNVWFVTHMCKRQEDSSIIINDLVKQINSNTESHGLKATADTNLIKLEGSEIGQNYEIVGGEGVAFGIKANDGTGMITITQEAEPAILDAAYVKDLASRCAAGKGFNYLSEDGKEIYPGYPEDVKGSKYSMYTIRFAVPRAAAKQRDEVVWQTLHICFSDDVDNTAVLAYVGKVFGLIPATES